MNRFDPADAGIDPAVWQGLPGSATPGPAQPAPDQQPQAPPQETNPEQPAPATAQPPNATLLMNQFFTGLTAFAEHQRQSQQDFQQGFATLAQQLAQALSLPAAAGAVPPAGVPPIPTPAPTTTPAVASTPVAVRSPTIKVREPRTFTGKADDVPAFLRDIRNAIALQRDAFRTDRDKAMYLSMYLKDGAPQSWYTAIELAPSKQHLLDNFEGLITDFRAHFETSDIVSKALRQLDALRQSTSVATYAARFQEILVHLDLSEATQIQRFYQGLKESVKDVLVTVRDLPTNLKDYIKLATDIDNRLHERDLERKHDKSSTRPRHDDHRSSTTTQQRPSAPAPSASASTTNSSGHVPMEVDAVRFGPLTSAEKERRRKNGLCLYCGQGNHRVSDCPNMSDKAKQNRKPAAAPASSGKA
ncbi:Retrotransposon-derived protein PEG10 [Trametes pubescens]|uniref:Retrotransposon-derived protein PEG10 n=1 Tax=Trametes pubescens TaxID=154538 RepID=A0A1M2VD98_TRAPU|nr:Retrotransposon-derived protein PEG10 [Trametes pubescens]